MSGIVLSFMISGLMKARLPEKDTPSRFQPVDHFVCQVLHLWRQKNVCYTGRTLCMLHHERAKQTLKHGCWNPEKTTAPHKHWKLVKIKNLPTHPRTHWSDCEVIPLRQTSTWEASWRTQDQQKLEQPSNLEMLHPHIWILRFQSGRSLPYSAIYQPRASAVHYVNLESRELHTNWKAKRNR